MLKNRKLSFKLNFFILTCCFAIFAVIFIYNYKYTRNVLLKNVEENAKNLTTAAVFQIERILDNAEKIPEGLAMVLEHSNYGEAEMKNFLTTAVTGNRDIFGACISFEPNQFDKNSYYYMLYCKRNKDAVELMRLGGDSYQYFYLDWYQIPKYKSEPFWTDPYFDEGAGNILMTTYSVPFYRNVDGKRVFRGIVTVDIDISWLSRIVNSIKLYDSGYGQLIARNGTIITHPDKTRIMNETFFTLAAERNDSEMRELGRKMIAGQTGFAPYTSGTLARKCWMYYKPLPSNRWILGATIPEDELLADLNDLTQTLGAMVGIGVSALFIVIVFLSGKITRPLRELAAAAVRIGGGDLEAALPENDSEDEIGALNSSFQKMKASLKEYIANLQKTTMAKEKIESELRVAHEIQMGIVPKIFPPYPDRKEIDIHAALKPAKMVGGDLFDFFFLDHDHLCFAIGDVSDKGVPASLFMAITRTLLRSSAAGNLSVSDIIWRINEGLHSDNDSSMFVTFFAGILNVRTGVIEYCNAGHNPPVVVRSGQNAPEVLPASRDIPLGVMERKFAVEKLTLNRGDFIFLYTDGVTEANDIEKKMYGLGRLCDLLARDKGMAPEALIGGVMKSVGDFAGKAEQSDDVATLAIRFNG